MPKIVPFGDNILVKRRMIGEKVGSLYMPDDTKERNTDLADVVYVPDLTFEDTDILDNAPDIFKTLVQRVKHGSEKALGEMFQMNDFVKRKSIKVGDVVFISKYVGTDFYEKGKDQNMTLVKLSDVIGLVEAEVGDE